MSNSFNSPGLPTPYGTAALEPPDEPDDTDGDYWQDMAADAKATEAEGN